MMKKALRVSLWMILMIYGYIVLNLLLLGRGVITDGSVWEHICEKSNFIPFRTLTEQISQYLKGEDRGFVLRNLGGNFFLLFPIGILLPCLFSSCKKLWKLPVGMTVFIVVAELLQGVLRIGFIDVDDLLLNVLGGTAGFALVQIPFVHRFLHRIGAMTHHR